MLNIIKMDLYRMLKTKSMYVIWIVLAAILLIKTEKSLKAGIKLPTAHCIAHTVISERAGKQD